jgi:hypothetical protein
LVGGSWCVFFVRDAGLGPDLAVCGWFCCVVDGAMVGVEAIVVAEIVWD